MTYADAYSQLLAALGNIGPLAAAALILCFGVPQLLRFIQDFFYVTRNTR